MKNTKDKKIIDRINKLYTKKKLSLLRSPSRALGRDDRDTILALYSESHTNSKKK